MKVHYFQRYHGKENVATANTMLLLSRLYTYSSDKFFRLLKSEYFSNSFNPEISFNLQEKNEYSVPDATITQESFKIVVETKMSEQFNVSQLEKHLNAFGDEKCKVLITLAPKLMSEKNKSSLVAKLKDYNKKRKPPVIHINTTFEALANAIDEQLDDSDYEMKAILNDYQDYCRENQLIVGSDGKKYMKMQLAGATLEYDVNASVYFNYAERGFRAHDFLGLYKHKSIRAVGKVIARITAVKTKKGVVFIVKDINNNTMHNVSFL